MSLYIGSTTVLGGAASYTSESRLTDRYDSIAGTVFSDQSGTLHVEQSNDGTNWDFDTSVPVVGATGGSFNVTVVANYWRLRYVNGATPQTSFRLHSKLRAAGDS